MTGLVAYGAYVPRMRPSRAAIGDAPGGALPVGGPKASGHPIGASGPRTTVDAFLRLRGQAPAECTIASIEQAKKPALTHNLGDGPGDCVSFVSVVGSEPSA